LRPTKLSTSNESQDGIQVPKTSTLDVALLRRNIARRRQRSSALLPRPFFLIQAASEISKQVALKNVSAALEILEQILEATASQENDEGWTEDISKVLGSMWLWLSTSTSL